MRDEDAEACREADEEVDDDGEDEARCADRCERLCTECLPDERRVGNAVELLEELREQDGQHEYEQLPENRTACKVLLIGTVEEQNVQMMQVVMEKVIGERVVHAVDVLMTFECLKRTFEIFSIHETKIPEKIFLCTLYAGGVPLLHWQE